MFLHFLLSSMRYFMHSLRFRQWRNSDFIFVLCGWKHSELRLWKFEDLQLLWGWRWERDLLGLIKATASPTIGWVFTTSFSAATFHRVNIWSLKMSPSQPIDSDLTNICPFFVPRHSSPLPTHHQSHAIDIAYFHSFSLSSEFISLPAQFIYWYMAALMQKRRGESFKHESNFQSLFPVIQKYQILLHILSSQRWSDSM